VNSDNSIEEEIQHRITLGNKAYYANQFFFRSRLVSKKSKLELYWNIIQQIITYACDTWVLGETIKKQVNGIWKESVKKDFWSYKRKRRYVENQNKRWIGWINKTEEYIKSHKSTKIKLVWPFTANAGRENGKKSIQVETDVITTTGETKEQMGSWYKERLEEIENKDLD